MDQHQEIFWGATIMSITTIIGVLGKHLWGHVQREDLAETKNSVKELNGKHNRELEHLKANVQYRDNCVEIVKRQDSLHQTTQDMVTRVLNKLDKLEAKL